MDFPFYALFYVVYYKVIGPMCNTLGVDMLYFVEQIIVKVKSIAKRQPVSNEFEGFQ